jgi:hypothetical protein
LISVFIFVFVFFGGLRGQSLLIVCYYISSKDSRWQLAIMDFAVNYIIHKTGGEGK